MIEKSINSTPSVLMDMNQGRRLLLHLKCLTWCLHQMQTRYNLNLVLHSLERGEVHPEISDSNLGDNVAFLIEHLKNDDLERISTALRELQESLSGLDHGDKHFEIGHYVQATQSFGPIKPGAYGIISRITPELRGLFLLEGMGGQVIEAPFTPEDVRVIFGTYVIS